MENAQTILRIEGVIQLSTEQLEQYIDARYEANAPQEELEDLETVYSQRVSEDDLNMTEEEPNMHEEIQFGASLEEWLIQMYHRYITPQERCGMELSGIIGNMRSTLEQYSNGKLKNPTNQRVLSAAKDVYEYKRNLINKYKSRNKLSIMPRNLRGIIE